MQTSSTLTHVCGYVLALLQLECGRYLDAAGGKVQNLQPLQRPDSGQGHIGLPLCKHASQRHLGPV